MLLFSFSFNVNKERIANNPFGFTKFAMTKDKDAEAISLQKCKDALISQLDSIYYYTILRKSDSLILRQGVEKLIDYKYEKEEYDDFGCKVFYKAQKGKKEMPF